MKDKTEETNEFKKLFQIAITRESDPSKATTFATKQNKKILKKF